MPLNKLAFKDAWEVRDKIDKAQQVRIQSLYTNWADQIKQKAKKYELKGAASAPLSALQYRELSDLLKYQSHDVATQIVMGLKQDIYTIADSVVKSNNDWLASLGLSGPGVESAFSSIPTTVVQNLVTGNIYKDGYSLSERIWGDNEDTLAKLYEIVGGGRAMNLSTYEITKQLEQFVRPGAAKQWNLRTKDGKRIYPKQVDYNAQRLARTLSQHAYQQSFVATTVNNPLIPKIVWWANGSRACKICMALHGQKFDKDKVPLDHPNGMCVLIPEVADDPAKQIADWIKSPAGTYPDLDKFALDFGYKAKPAFTAADFVSKYGTSQKTLAAWHNGMSAEQKADALKLKNESGLTWEKWYEKNVYTGDGSNLGKKRTSKKAQTAPAANDVFDKQAWLDSLHSNNLRKMSGWCDDWLKAISYDEKSSVVEYTGSSYSGMNDLLRGIRHDSRYIPRINGAKSALSKASLPEDVIVRRGSDLTSLKALLQNDSGAAIAANVDKYIGAVVTDGGFLSTTPDPQGGFSSSVNFVIKVPKGSDAMYIAPISNFPNEKELLINAGQKFIIEGFDLERNGYIKNVFMRMIK